MKKLIVSTVVLVATTSTFATGTQSQTPVSQTQTSTSESNASASNAGNQQSIIFTSPSSSTSSMDVKQTGDTTSRVVYSGSQTIKNVPSVSGPPLVTSNDTCMGSVSGSLNFAGFGGGLGSTVIDENCKMLKNSRELWNMGMRGAALARMCMDSSNKEALEITGFECPQTVKTKGVVEQDKKVNE